MLAQSIRQEVEANDKDIAAAAPRSGTRDPRERRRAQLGVGRVERLEAFEARFQESNVSVTNRIADLGLFQLMNTGTGTVEGFGPATMVLAMSQDRSVTPCGPGSWTNAGIRRIVVAAGVLILRANALRLPDRCRSGRDEHWQVDGDSSTGVFAGARGAAPKRCTSRPRSPRSRGS